MLLHNFVLLVHFVAFLGYAAMLVLQYPKNERSMPKAALALGIAILATGIWLVVMKYPAVNYYKVIPKLIAFVVISTLNGIYSGKPLPVKAYITMLSLTILASMIAVVKL